MSKRSSRKNKDMVSIKGVNHVTSKNVRPDSDSVLTKLPKKDYEICLDGSLNEFIAFIAEGKKTIGFLMSLRTWMSLSFNQLMTVKNDAMNAVGRMKNSGDTESEEYLNCILLINQAYVKLQSLEYKILHLSDVIKSKNEEHFKKITGVEKPFLT